MRIVHLIALLGLAACQPAAAPEAPGAIEKTGAVVVTVDGETVTQDMVDAITRKFPPGQLEQLKKNPEQWKQFLEKIAVSQLLYKQALEQKLHEDPDVRKTIAMTERDVLASELIESVAEKSVTDEAVQKYYDDHKVQFARPSAHVHHIVVGDEKLAQDLAGQIKAGADFATLASQHSLDRGGPAGNGDLGWIEKGRLIPDLEQPAFAATVGDVVGPIRTQHGFHVMRVVEKRDATPIADVRDQIVERLKGEKVQEYIDNLKKEAKIEYAGEAQPQVELTPMPSGGAPAGGAPAGGAPAGGEAPAHP